MSTGQADTLFPEQVTGYYDRVSEVFHSLTQVQESARLFIPRCGPLRRRWAERIRIVRGSIEEELHIMDAQELADAEQQWLDSWARGPQRARWDRIPLQIGDRAPDLELTDHTGATRTRLSSLWTGRTAVVLFWRHFGCSCGRDRAARLRDEYAELVGLGATVTIIGQAGPERSAAYREANAIPCDILSDPDEVAYRAFDVLEGTTAQVLFDASDDLLACALPAGIELAASRHGTERASVDNPFLLPAEFVVTDGVVQLAYRYQYCEDWPDARVLTSAVRFGGAPSL